MKLEKILKEVQQEAEISALDKAMGDAFKALGAEFKNKESAIKQDVENSEAPVTESIGVVAIIGFLLALPKLVEVIVKGMSKLVSVFKRFIKPGEGKQNPEEMATKIVEFTHKWHKQYIKGLKWILNVSGAFKKAGIKSDSEQTRAAELIYYAIVAGLAVYSGVGSVSAFKSVLSGQVAASGGFSLAAFEAAMATVKTGEVVAFLGKLGLKTSA